MKLTATLVIASNYIISTKRFTWFSATLTTVESVLQEASFLTPVAYRTALQHLFEITQHYSLAASSVVCMLHLFVYILPCMLAGNLAWHIQCSSRRQLVREVSFVWMNHLISSSHAAHPAIFTVQCNWPLCFPSVACLHSLSYSLCCPAHPQHQRHKGVLCFCQQVMTEARSNRIHKSR